MKKILLTMVAFVFCITSVQAETSQHSINTAAYISQSLANKVSVVDILITLVKDNVTLPNAVTKVIKAGGDQQDTLAAALIINPNFTYNDPTLSLSPTASGSAGYQKSNQQTNANKSSVGVALSGGGGASPF